MAAILFWWILASQKIEGPSGDIVLWTVHDIDNADAYSEPLRWTLGTDLLCKESNVSWSPPPPIKQQNDAEVTKKGGKVR